MSSGIIHRRDTTESHQRRFPRRSLRPWLWRDALSRLAAARGDTYVGGDWSHMLHRLKAGVVTDLNEPLPAKWVADTVLFLPLMEHLCERRQFLAEAHGILKSGRLPAGSWALAGADGHSAGCGGNMSYRPTAGAMAEQTLEVRAENGWVLRLAKKINNEIELSSYLPAQSELWMQGNYRDVFVGIPRFERKSNAKRSEGE